MSIISEILSRLTGISCDDPDEEVVVPVYDEMRKLETEKELEQARGNLRNQVQNVRSGGRVISNMAGMLKMMDEERGKNRS